MHATSRDRVAYDLALGKRGARLIPPPPPPRAFGSATANVNAKSSGAHAARSSALDAEPKWLEDAVLRIIQKHGLQAPAAEPAYVEIDDEDLHFLPAPVLPRLWRVVRSTLIVVVLLGAAGGVARWRYPSQTATFVAGAKGAAARVGVASAWMRARWARLPSIHSLTAPNPNDAPPVWPPPAPAPVVQSAVPTAVSPIAPPIAPAATPSTVSLTDLPLAAADPSTPLPVATAPLAPAARKATPVDVAPPAPKLEPKHVAHVAHTTPSVAPPAETAAEPAPGSLADAIKRAGGGGKVTPVPAPIAPAAERASAPDPKPAIDATLPERPSASVVTSALLAVLPDARACMSDGEEPTRAAVVFASSGAVSSVQVGGTSASCIHKALARAHVAPFSQASYRATVPVRPN
jgi:hypothetical protein